MNFHPFEKKCGSSGSTTWTSIRHLQGSARYFGKQILASKSHVCNSPGILFSPSQLVWLGAGDTTTHGLPGNMFKTTRQLCLKTTSRKVIIGKTRRCSAQLTLPNASHGSKPVAHEALLPSWISFKRHDGGRRWRRIPYHEDSSPVACPCCASSSGFCIHLGIWKARQRSLDEAIQEKWIPAGCSGGRYPLDGGRQE